MAKSIVRRAEKTESRLKPPARIGVYGAGGRMGQEILQLWSQVFTEPHVVSVSKGPLGHRAKQAFTKLSEVKPKTVDVWIDFSSPQGLLSILDFCVKNQTPMVSGTTGLEKKHHQALKLAAKKIPVLWSPNMSLGINILLKSLNAFSGVRGFDFQIEEAHHRYKKDKPSGTALHLKQGLEKVISKKIDEPLALRGGGIFGIHKVWAMSDEETLIFEHQALNRRVFARGAIEAALWLNARGPGLYSIQDLLGDAN